jgi:hypothetical protein
LINYLRELATVLGEDEAIHLVDLESSSTVPVLKIDNAVRERVYKRAAEVRSGIAPREAMLGYRRLNQMLREDRGTGSLYEEGNAEIIPFPGSDELPGSISGIQQEGTLDGKLLKVGGARDWVPVQLQTPDEIITGCYAKRTTAKDMGSHLFDEIRLYGRGRWTRTERGDWILDRFWIDNFEPLSPKPLPDVVASLRAIRANWRPNPIAGIHTLRSGTDEGE